MAVIASSLSPILAADTLKLSLYYKRTFTDVAILTGWHLLGVGIGGFVFVPSSRIWGKRHAYLLGTVIVIISSAWGGASGHNFKSAIASRMFQGIGLAPYEALVNASVGDLFFVHERGKRMAVSNFCVFGGAFMTPVIVGKMSHTMGWQWSFYFVAIFAGAMLPFIYFFVPETAYRRDPKFNTDTATTLGDQMLHIPAAQAPASSRNDSTVMSSEIEKGSESPANGGDSPIEQPTKVVTPQPATFKQKLAIFNGRKTDDSFIKLLFRPLPLFFHPSIFWACLIQGTLIGWTVFLGIVLAAIMLGPPLFFNEVQTGYMYTGAFVGALVGFLLSGLLSDPTMKWLARRNNGVYEPEFRLILVIPQLILGCAGLYGFGITAANTARYGWFWPAFFFGCEVAGMVVGAVASGLYVVDAYRKFCRLSSSSFGHTNSQPRPP
jgi:MFS family permease